MRQIRFNDWRVLLRRYRDLLEVEALRAARTAAMRRSRASSAFVAILCFASLAFLYVAACIGRGLS